MSKTESETNELILSVMESELKQLTELSVRQLQLLTKYYNLKKKGTSKFILISQLSPIRTKQTRIKQLVLSNYQEECPICLNMTNTDTYFITSCTHIFCQECILRHILSNNNDFCPLCRDKIESTDINIDSVSEKILERIGILKITPELLETGLFILQNMRFQKYITDPDLIGFIQTYQNRQKIFGKIVLYIKFLFILTLIYNTLIYL
jgi:hypothetical protein